MCGYEYHPGEDGWIIRCVGMGDAGCGSWKSKDIGWVGVRVGGETGRRDGENKNTPGEDVWI